MNRSKRFVFGATQKWLLVQQCQLIDSLVFLLLFLYVLADLLLIAPHGRDKVPSGPESFTREVSRLSHKRSGDLDRTLSLHVPDHLRYRILRRNRYQHMHMVAQEVPFFYPALSNCLSTSSSCWRRAPYNAFLRYFGMYTMWYLHSHFVWLRLTTFIKKSPFRATLSGSRIGDFLFSPRNCQTPGVPQQSWGFTFRKLRIG